MVLELINSGIGLASQILARTSPKEFKELTKLKKLRLKYDGLITDYMRLKPSERNQAKLETYIKELRKVDNGILVSQDIADTKLKIMLAQHGSSSS